VHNNWPVFLVSAKSDLDIINEALGGSEAAYSLLTDRYWKKVCSFLRKKVNDSFLAEELTQETFLNAYRYLHTFRGDSNFYTWLCTIAINKLSRKPVNSLKTDSEMVDRHTPEDELDSKQRFNKLLDVISNLPIKQQRALIMRFIDGLSYSTIAERLQCSPEYARVLVCTAKATLRSKHGAKRKLSDDGSLTQTSYAECV
jgi:RNA polymerase sigma-70 factor (ECF subfamily)